jgi:hypothetical protein
MTRGKSRVQRPWQRLRSCLHKDRDAIGAPMFLMERGKNRRIEGLTPVLFS